MKRIVRARVIACILGISVAASECGGSQRSLPAPPSDRMAAASIDTAADAGNNGASSSSAAGALVDRCAGIDAGSDGGRDAAWIDVELRREPLRPARPGDIQGCVSLVIREASAGRPSSNDVLLHKVWVDLAARLDCSTTVYRAAQRLTATCGTAATGFTLEARVDGQRIVLTDGAGDTDGTSGPRELAPPVSVPCGARVVFHELAFRDAGWIRMGDACSSRCRDRYNVCEHPCLENLTDADSNLTDAGVACDEKCTERSTACEARCSSP
jgi:hypothetical protein